MPMITWLIQTFLTLILVPVERFELPSADY
jgi:hypothetical protein